MKKKYYVVPLLVAGLALKMSPALAESSVTLYGVLDEFVGYQSTKVNGQHTSQIRPGSNGEMTSRFGLRGVEDLGNGYRATFDLENGFDPTTGIQQNSYRLFDRQAWVGLGAAQYGEIRLGRQNSVMFGYSGMMDAFGAATYGSGLNNFANWLARVDHDVAYLSPNISGTQFELHYSGGGQTGSLGGNAVYQAGVQTSQGPVNFAIGYLKATNATNTVRVQQLLMGGNVDYGSGKVYLSFFRGNDVISATTGNALSNPAGKYDTTVGPVGNTPGNYYNTFSLSADYRFNASLSVGAGVALTKDSSSLHNDARQVSAIVNYDLSKRTRLYGVVSYLKNRNTAQFKMAGASITPGTFLTPDAGASQTGIQLGIRHIF